MSTQGLRVSGDLGTRQGERAMTSRELDDAAVRGDYLVLLRHGIRQSARLGEQLAGDALLGNEVSGLMGRLRAIRAELDAMTLSGPHLRHAPNDLFWTDHETRPECDQISHP